MRQKLPLAAVFWVAAICCASCAFAQQDTIASTYNFTGSGGTVAGGQAGTPIAATTEFGNIFFGESNADQVNTATHELFHGVGFAAAYNNLSNNLYTTPGAGANGIPADSRAYSTNGMVGGILMVLTPSAQGTHADPLATGAAPWPATGYNEANDIMQPNILSGATLSAVDGSVLMDAFGWGTVQGITVNVINDDPQLTAQNLTNIEAAVTAVQNLFDVNVPGPGEPNFTWTLVPEPSELALLGVFAIACLSRRRCAA